MSFLECYWKRISHHKLIHVEGGYPILSCEYFGQGTRLNPRVSFPHLSWMLMISYNNPSFIKFVLQISICILLCREYCRLGQG